MNSIKVALLQTHVSEKKEENLSVVREKLRALRAEKPDLVTLPEMFSCPYQTDQFPVYAEPQGGESWQALSCMAKEEGIYLAAGSVRRWMKKERCTTRPMSLTDREDRSQSIGKCTCSISM